MGGGLSSAVCIIHQCFWRLSLSLLSLLSSHRSLCCLLFFPFLPKISNKLFSRCIFDEGSALAPSRSIFFQLNILNLKRQQEDGQFALAATWNSPDVVWRDRTVHSEADNNEIILRWVTSLHRFTANHAQVRDLKAAGMADSATNKVILNLMQRMGFNLMIISRIRYFYVNVCHLLNDSDHIICVLSKIPLNYLEQGLTDTQVYTLRQLPGCGSILMLSNIWMSGKLVRNCQCGDEHVDDALASRSRLPRCHQVLFAASREAKAADTCIMCSLKSPHRKAPPYQSQFGAHLSQSGAG